MRGGGGVTLDMVDAPSRKIGFDPRCEMNVPQSATGVWTLSRDMMNTNSTDPMSDRTVHADQYTEKVLIDVRFADYPLFGKALAVGIALHLGTLGLRVSSRTSWYACRFCSYASILWCFGGNAARRKLVASRHLRCQKNRHFGKARFWWGWVFQWHFPWRELHCGRWMHWFY